MSLINTLLTELEARHAQHSPAQPPPADLQHLQAVQPDEDAMRRRRWILLVTAMLSTFAAAWVVFFPTLLWNWRFWESPPSVEVLREEQTTPPTVQLLADAPSLPDAFGLPDLPPDDPALSPATIPSSANVNTHSPVNLPSPSMEIPPPTQPPPPANRIQTPLPPANKLENSPSITALEKTPIPAVGVASATPALTTPNPKIEEKIVAMPKPSAPKKTESSKEDKNPAKSVAKMEIPPTSAPENSEKPPKFESAPTLALNPDLLAQQSYQEAKRAIKKGFLADAENYLRDTLKSSPKHVGARGSLAGLYIEQGRWMEAEHVLNEGLKLNPQELSFIRWQSRVLIEQGAEKQALQLMEEAPESAMDDPEFCGFLATLYNRANNFEKAVPMYRKALGLKPTEGRWWIGLASVYERKQNYPAAIDAYAHGASDNRIETSLANFAKERIANLRTRLDR